MSIHTVSPRTVTVSSPAFVWAVQSPSGTLPSCRSSAKEATVAWPHSSTSPAGVK